MQLTTLGASARDGYTLQNFGLTPARGATVPSVPTRMRFCTSNFLAGVDCKAPGNVTRDRALLDDPGGQNPGLWWRMSFTDGDFSDGQPLDYGEATRTVNWNHLSNAAAWAASGNFVPPDSTGSCTPVGASPGHSAICLNGLVWTLADTLLGADSDHAGFVGPAGALNGTQWVVGVHADHLSASLTKMNPEYTGGFYGPGVGWEEKFRRPVILTLPDPPWWTDAAVPYVRNEALILSAVNSNALVVHANGDAESMGASVSGALYNLLAEFETMPDAAPTQQWLDLGDPQTRGDRPLAVVARKQSNGSWKFDSVLDYYGGLNLESDYGNPLRYGSVASLPTTPMVYSPADDALWTAGTNVLQRHAAGTSSFVNVLPANADIKPANVKAIAFDAARQAAWVVDYTATGLPRLLRFAKNGAGVWTGAILSQGTTAGAASDKHYLNLLPDGRVVYARTNVAANTRVVARFSYAGGGVLAALLTGAANYSVSGTGGGVVSGALLARPLVDGSGYHQMIAGQVAPVGGDPTATPPDTTYPLDLPPGMFPANDTPGLPPPGPNPSGPAPAGYTSDDGARSGIPVPPSAVFP
jgi:hypothetical protein